MTRGVTAPGRPDIPSIKRRSAASENTRTLLKRLLACLFGGLALAVMIGNQEGTQPNLGAFRQAVGGPRIVVFLLIGVVVFLAITFRSVATRYVARPSIVPLGIGVLLVVVAQFVMNWYDPQAESNGSSKFDHLGDLVDKTTTGLQTTTTWFFDWLGWTALAVSAVVCIVAVVTRIRPIGYLATLVALAGAVFAYLAHDDVVSFAGGVDHSLGVYADVLGFLAIAVAGVTVARARTDHADTRAFVLRILDFRPGLVYAVLAVVLGLFALINDGWFGPATKNFDFGATGTAFDGTAINGLASQYLSWLGWTLFVAAAVLALLAAWARRQALAAVAIVVGVAGLVMTFFSLKSMTEIAAKVAPTNGTAWKNLGVGGYLEMLVFALFTAAGLEALLAARVGRSPRREGRKDAAGRPTSQLPLTALVDKVRASARLRTGLFVALAVAVLYPPMLTQVWQNVLVSQIGVYLLLAIGLNVVVGWAGLLDLGYIAFYEIGAYTTAYLTGALPRKPPSWLHLTPILAIPFAIVACLIAGVVLGAPTLRLRGDYLAIVTLAFGEITQVVALNNPGNFTGGPQGPVIGHPVIHIGSWHITWGQDNLPYWYLLLIMLVVVLVLFWRLEGARLGRAWAAIREDEVAAQSSGVNTTRVKLLAFAIGASTSALAGWFFATQIGYFDPTLYTLQASVLIVAYVVFGGMGSLPGALAGAFVLTWVPQFLKSQVPLNDRQMWVGALVLAMMIFRPSGLLPARRRKAELDGLDHVASSEVTAVPTSEGL